MPLRERARVARRFLDRTLFPPPRAEDSRLGRGEKAILITGLLVLAIGAQLARIGRMASFDSLWAEDGQVFLQNALTKSFFDAVTAEYSGYFVLVPRLIGEVASAFPLAEAPVVVSILSALLIAVSGLVVWFATANHLANPYLRGTLALLTVLTPVGGLETIASASNISWFMLVGVFWLLLWRPRTYVGAVLAAVFIAAAALSNPGIWFFAPLAALRAFAVRDGRDLTILAGYFGAGLIQIASLALTDYEAVEPIWTSDVWTVLLQRVFDGMILGLELGGTAWVKLGWPLLIALTALLVTGLLVGLARCGAQARAFAALAVPIALAMFVVSIYQRAVATPMLWPAGDFGAQAGRYSIVPVMLLISVAFMFIDRPPRPRREWARADWLLAGTVGLLLVAASFSLPAKDFAARGTPPWDDSVDAAAAACAADEEGEASLAISPPGFGVMLPCTAVPDASGSDPRR